MPKQLVMICVAAVFLIGLTSPSVQAQQKAKPRVLALQDILSCADDPFISSVFGLDGDDLSKLIPQAKAFDPMREKFYGFWVGVVPTASKQSFTILSKERNDSFCHYYPTINGFATPDNEAKKYPITVTIDAGEAWTLGPNEVFAHADQFSFESGLFDNSTEVFLIAKRGVTSIQFKFVDNKLKFYRVFYNNPKFK